MSAQGDVIRSALAQLPASQLQADALADLWELERRIEQSVPALHREQVARRDAEARVAELNELLGEDAGAEWFNLTARLAKYERWIAENGWMGEDSEVERGDLQRAIRALAALDDESGGA